MSAEGLVKRLSEKWSYLIWNAHSESVADHAGVTSKVESAIREALNEYAASREEWVDVRERMPDSDTDYTVVRKMEGFNPYVDTARFIKSIRRFGMELNHGKVTHWRPLPQAPGSTGAEEAERE